MSNWNLSGKTALITGGTHGIGLACANEFAELGADVIVVARYVDLSIPYKLMVADITKEGDRKKVLSGLDKVDILVNNVGINITKSSEEFSFSDIGQLIDTNFIASFEMTRLLLPLLKVSGNASVINIASVAGVFDVGTGSIYAAMKAAIIQLTKSLAVEYAPFNIRVNAVSPWYTDTRRTQNFLSDDVNKKAIITRTPLKRIAVPSDIAGLVAFLAMNKSGYITGQNMLVDGGLSAYR